MTRLSSPIPEGALTSPRGVFGFRAEGVREREADGEDLVADLGLGRTRGQAVPWFRV
jgi:hypothetical protein